MLLKELCPRHFRIGICAGAACADRHIDQIGIALGRDLLIRLLNLERRDLCSGGIFLRIVDHFIELLLREVDLLAHRLALDRDRDIEHPDAERFCKLFRNVADRIGHEFDF